MCAHARAAPQIRRKYRNLITKEHPDKGGDAERFAAIQRSYDVLSSAPKRQQYDATGRAERTADEELVEAFGGGANPRALLKITSSRVHGRRQVPRQDARGRGGARHPKRVHHTAPEQRGAVAQRRLRRLAAVTRRYQGARMFVTCITP